MTITSTDQRKAYEGNGLATQFVGPRAFKAEHLRVFVGDDPSYTLVPTSQYTVRGLSANQTVVTFNTAPASGKDILILRTVPYDQPTSVTNQGVFLPQIHEDAFDYRVMQIQQLEDGSLSLVFDDETGRFVWDAKNQRIIRVADAILDQDAVNLRTMANYVAGMVDVKRNAVSILATKLTFDNTETSTTTAATPAVFATNGDTLSAGDIITIDVTQIGTALAKGLQVVLVGQRTS